MEDKLLAALTERFISKEKHIDLWLEHLSNRINAINHECPTFHIDYGNLYSIIGEKRVNLGRVRGEDGYIGKDGSKGADGKRGEKGERGARGAKGDIGISGRNGVDGKDGKDGSNGLNGTRGIKGKDGVGISDAWINEKGELILLLTNNKEINVGVVVGRDGIRRIISAGGSSFDGTKSRVSSDTTITQKYYHWFVNTDDGDVDIALYPGVDSDRWRVINTGTSGNQVVISPASGDNLLGDVTSFLLSDGEALVCVFDSTDGWY
jgi:hypothetical protein